MDTGRIAAEPSAPGAPPTVSLAMIVADLDADDLAGAIESARPYVDQLVVVVDPTATNARAAAEAAGAEVYEHAWSNDFAAARNAALDRCTGHWVLVLDADERLVVRDEAAFREAMATRPAIYLLTVTSPTKGGLPVLNDTPRLFPRWDTVRYHGELHETPMDSQGVLQHEGMTALAIAHHGYTPEAVAKGVKTLRNLNILEGMVTREPCNPQYRLYVAQALAEGGMVDAAQDQQRCALHFCRIFDMKDSGGCYDQAASDLVGLLSTAGYHHQAVAEARVAMEWREPEHPAFWCNLSNAQFNVGVATQDPEEAARHYATAVASAYRAIQYRVQKVQQYSASCVTWLPEATMGMALANLGRDAEALLALDRALALDPGYHEAAIQSMRAKVVARMPIKDEF